MAQTKSSEGDTSCSDALARLLPNCLHAVIDFAGYLSMKEEKLKSLKRAACLTVEETAQQTKEKLEDLPLRDKVTFLESYSSLVQSLLGGLVSSFQWPLLSWPSLKKRPPRGKLPPTRYERLLPVPHRRQHGGFGGG